MSEPKSMTRVQVLREMFFRIGKDELKTFMTELRELNEEEKVELSSLAAIQLGVTIKSA